MSRKKTVKRRHIVNKGSAEPEIHPTLQIPKWTRRTTFGLLGVVVLSGILLFAGLNWGQPGGHPWHQDSIAGSRTVAHRANLFKAWRAKYPRAQYLIVSAFYKPYLDAWEANPVVVGTGPTARTEVLTVERISKLVMISRVVTAIMGVGAVVAVFLTVRLLFYDELASILAAAALACSMAFVFYGHLGNVDVPATFWLAWATYWAVKAVYIGKWRHYLLVGLFCALTVCTKEPLAGYLIGLGLAAAICFVTARMQLAMKLKSAALSLFNLKVLAAVGMAGLVFALMNDLFTTPQAFRGRMDFWFKVGIDEYNQGITYLNVFVGTGKIFWYSFGWPMLAAIIASTVYCAKRYRTKALFALLPLLAFFFLITLRTKLSIDRYFVPGAAGLAILTGKACADLLRYQKLHIAVRIAPVATVYVLSLLYCIGLDMELIDDSRYRAEHWLRQNVSKTDLVAALSQAAYAPRINTLDCRSHFENRRPKDDNLLAQLRPHAKYLVLSEKEYILPSAFDPEFLKSLLAGEKGYDEAARFSNRYLYPRKTPLGIAGWPIARSIVISPETIILKRQK